MSDRALRWREPIAIVGIGNRFPGANGPSAFWRLLEEGRDVITEVPAGRFDVDALYDPVPGTAGKLISKWGGFVDGIDRFDPGFFGVTAREARHMDPQQRLALEVAFEALENAGQKVSALKGKPVGVFVGICANEYQELEHRDLADLNVLVPAGGGRNGVSGRISYALGLQGVSVALDTDRSSSLVAVHMACTSIDRGESSMALAGATNLVLTPEPSLAFSRAMMLSPDGRCKFGDARANGFVRSDGICFVVLKKLSAALADGDRIYATLLGSAVNHDAGRSGDFMAPSSASQIALLTSAYENAGVRPVDVQYVEAHGPGTQKGDPEEIRALATVLQGERGERPPLRVGSVKTNIGHAETAAGLAGLIKVALSLHHRKIPASLHFETPNPKISFDGIVIPTATVEWPDPSRPLFAGVTSLGLTGTNAHVVLGDAPRAASPSDLPAREEILTISAKNDESLAALGERTLAFLGESKSSAHDIAYTASVRRDHHDHRVAVVGSTREELAQQLATTLKKVASVGSKRRPFASGRAKVAFVFPGQGSQWLGMGRELLHREAVFREAMTRCDEAIRRVAGWSLLEELSADGARSRLTEFRIVQPVLVSIEIALATLWKAFGVEPDVVVGTSMGEIAAAHVAGILSLDDAMKVICRRSVLMYERWNGKSAMGVIGRPASDVDPLLAEYRDRVWIAGINSPVSTVVAGEREAVEELLQKVKASGVHGALVRDMLSSHTPHVDAIATELTADLAGVTPQGAHIPMMSSVTGQLVQGGLDGVYWVQNLREPIRFADAVQKLIASGYDTFIEVSPHPVLVGPILDALAQAGREAVAVGTLRRNDPERRSMLQSLAALYSSGLDVDWARSFALRPSVVDLPAYAWKQERYWYSDQPRTRTRPTVTSAQGAESPSEAPPAATKSLTRTLSTLQPTERRAFLLEHVRGQVALVLGVAPELVELQRPLREHGLTSFLGVELASLLSGSLGRTFAPTLLFNHPTVEALVEYLAKEDAPTAGLIGEIFIDTGILTAESLEAALAEQARSKTKERLGAVLVRMGLVTTEQLQRALSYQLSEPIAIVGLACRFPGAPNPEAFWRLLDAGVDAIDEVPADRWNTERVFNPAKKTTTKWGGFIEEIDRFDAAFFGIMPREAEEMDPQQRLLLEVASDALENAGQSREELVGTRTGVFVGITNNNDYVALKRLAEDPSRVRAHHGTGTATSIAAGRLSYTLGLNGPAMAIDTACSSSLVAVHLAMQSLRSGECKTALAGGVNAILSPEISLAYSQAGMLSPTGRCKTFDASADGYVRSEGCGMIVLKRLSDARAHGDNVLAVLIGSAVNQDGRSSGLTAPSGTAQTELVRQALASAGVHPSEVNYVEAHGTGTPLGDPIEVQALGEALKEGRTASTPFIVGSVKTNIGHLESAAGVAGLMKVVLSLQHQTIPRHLHLNQVNPLLGTETLPMKIPVTPIAWPAGHARRIAGISSFGFSGTNCHVLVEEAPPGPSPSVAKVSIEVPSHIVPVSARNQQALVALTERYAEHLAHGDVDLAALSYTASVGRTHYEERAVVLASSLDDARERLKAAATNVDAIGVFRGRVPATRPRIAFLFTGQGSQYVGMGRTLYETQPVFRDALDTCATLLSPYLALPLLSVLYPKADEPSVLSQTAYTQPALFAIEYALSELWRSWGIIPEAVLGHSVGEYVAACVAGVLGLEDALRLIATRGRLMQALPAGGAMAAVRAGEERVRSEMKGLEDRVSIAALNGPGMVVISGEEGAVGELGERFTSQGIQTRRLDVSHAFHSVLMDPMLDEFEQVVRTLKLEAPKIALAANVTGTLGGDDMTSSEYWRRHIREPVRFADGIQVLKARGIDTFVEVGPHPSLLSMGAQCVPEGFGRWLPSLRRGKGDWDVLLESVAQLHLQGAKIDWEGFHRPYERHRISLPSYPWQKQRYWVDTSRALRRPGQETGHALLGSRIPVAGTGHGRRRGKDVTKVFETVLGTTVEPYLADHVVFEKAIVPAAVHVELARAASEVCFGPGAHQVSDFVVQAPLVLAAGQASRVQVVVSETEDEQRLQVAIYSQPIEAAAGDEWTLHVHGTLQRDAGRPVPSSVDVENVRASLGQSEPVAQTYELLADAGLQYGPAFQVLKAVYRGDKGILASVGTELAQEGYGIHPVILDAGLQALVSLVRTEDQRTYLPFEITDFTLWNPGGVAAWVYATTKDSLRSDAEVLSGAVRILDEAGQVLAEISDIKLKRADGRMQRATATREALYPFAWRELPRRAAASFDPRGAWVVLADGSDVGEALVTRLDGAGVRTFTSLEDAQRSGQPVDSVVCVWRARGATPDDGGEQLALAALEVIQSVTKWPQPPRLWWVTEGAEAVREGERTEIAASTIWGLGRTVMLEHPELQCTLIDVEPNADAASALWNELGAFDEPERALRSGQLFVPRIAKPKTGLEVPDSPNYALRSTQKGQLDKLSLASKERRAPKAGEVQIEVEAAALNFRDVLNALGMYPGEAGELGLECAGVITEVGEGVTDFARGDRVMGIAPASFGRFVTVNEGFIVRQYEKLSSEESAALPIAFLTAYHAFADLARLKPGERVLIHAAAGGVGMAAVQIAKWLGAEVFATASPSKWDIVRAMGVEHIASSRTLDFADTFRKATGGHGVDVVLNALAGEFTDASLALLAPGGRFIEMGKTDLRDPAAIAISHPGKTYQAFDLLTLEASEISRKLRALDKGFTEGKLTALPITTFELTNAETAFRTMAQARHTGKIVLTRGGKRAPLFSAKSTVLVTGGLGALGMRLAQWLIEEHRVAHVVLMARSTPSSERLAEIERLRQLGAEITVAQADVTEAADLRATLAAIPKHLPLRAVMHAAGVLDDGILSRQDAARFTRVLRPKLRGTWNLHEQTRGAELEHFVLFSSITSVLGSAGQGNYAAANAFLDALAADRRASGLPAVSINWGPWAEGGMAEKLKGKTAPGWDMLPALGALDLLDQALRRPDAQVVAMSLDTRALERKSDLAAVWRELCPKDRRKPVAAAAAKAAPVAAGSPETRKRDMEMAVRTHVAKIAELSSPADVPLEVPLKEFGLDSLMVVELRNRLATDLGIPFPASVLFDYPTVAKLTEYLVGRVAPAPTAAATTESRTVERAPSKEIDDGSNVLERIFVDSGLITTEQFRQALEEQKRSNVHTGLGRVLVRLGFITSAQLQRALSSQFGDESIAVVGMACRFPAAEDQDAYWRLLEGGKSAIATVPSDRWDADSFFDANQGTPGKTYARWGGFISNPDKFDAQFFAISPREAESMDPRQRILLETAWEALENAGQRPGELQGRKVGVYLGLQGWNDYTALKKGNVDPTVITGHDGTGDAISVAGGRISYFLGLTGPNVVIDTACSSSLVAIHLACQSLRSGESSMAIAGSVNLILTPEMTIAFTQAHMLSPNGRCATFDASADGYVRGEGCGIVVLKCLSDALADGDNILGIIRGTAINQDGKTNGLTAPSGRAQQAVIQEALQVSGVRPADVQYIETHGTGTRLGDPIEVNALGAVLNEGRDRANPLKIGSVKTNVGHLEAAAGVAGLIKVLLSLKHEKLPAHLNFKTINPEIMLDEFGFEIPLTTEPWPRRPGRPRIAGISAFGFSGTNAHMIVEEPPLRSDSVDKAPASPQIITLSAKAEAALKVAAARHGEFLATSGRDFAELAASYNTGRAQFQRRLAVVADDASEASRQFAAAAKGEIPSGVFMGAAGTSKPRIAFLYTGNGSEHAKVRDLYATSPVFRDAIDRCAAVVEKMNGTSLTEALFDESGSVLSDPVRARLALFALEYALTELWRHFGIVPDAVMGLDVGEYAAACAAGAFSVEAALERVLELARIDLSNAPSQLASRMVSTVDGLEQGMKALLERGIDTFVELGPSDTLLRLGQPLATGPARWVASLANDRAASRHVLEALAQLYVHGAAVDWAAIHAGAATRHELPTYAFQRKRHFVKSPPATAIAPAAKSATAHASGAPRPERTLLGYHLRSVFPAVQFESVLDAQSFPLLKDYVVANAIVMPAAMHISRLLLASRSVGIESVELSDVEFRDPMLFEGNEERVCRLTLTPRSAERYSFELASTRPSATAAWQVHAIGAVATAPATEIPYELSESAVQLFASKAREELTGDQFYEGQRARGYVLGPAFRCVEKVWFADGEACAQLHVPEGLDDSTIQAAAIESCLQIASRISATPAEDDAVLVAGSAERLRFAPAAALGRVLHCVIRSAGSDAEIEVYANGKLIISATRLRLKRTSRAQPFRAT